MVGGTVDTLIGWAPIYHVDGNIMYAKNTTHKMLADPN